MLIDKTKTPEELLVDLFIDDFEISSPFTEVILDPFSGSC